MQKIVLLFMISVGSFSQAFENPEAFRCRPQPASESLVYLSTSIFLNMEDLKTAYDLLYSSGSRLRDRFYWDQDQGTYMGFHSSGSIEVPTSFIKSVTQHIETALQRGYADFAFYPDMGHGHLLIEEQDVNKSSLQEIIRSQKSKILYHTGELFRFRSGSVMDGPLPTDPWLAWRYHTRNFVGDLFSNDNLSVLFGGHEGGYNTVRKIPDYRQVLSIYFSASKDGCFDFMVNGEKKFFDISFKGSHSKPL